MFVRIYFNPYNIFCVNNILPGWSVLYTERFTLRINDKTRKYVGQVKNLFLGLGKVGKLLPAVTTVLL
jgi:hypothetical protein